LIILGILAVILGFVYLADYIRYLFRKFFSHGESENGLQA
jgi:hypothetical protein